MASTYTLDELLKNPDIKRSPADQFGVIFFESKDLDIHEYRGPQGNIVPGTTSTIGGMSGVEGLGLKGNRYTGMVYDHESESLIDRATMSRASERGTRLHGAIEHWVGHRAGNFNDAQLKEAISGLANDEERNAFEAVKDFYLNDKRAKRFDMSTAKTELSLSSKEYGFAGTIDVHTRLHNSEDSAIIDYKFGSQVKRKAGYQTAANRITLHEHGETGNIERYVLHVPEPRPGEKHQVNLYSEKTHPEIFGSYEEDKKYFLNALKSEKKAANIGLEEAKNIAKVDIARALEVSKAGGKFGLIHIGFGEDGAEQFDLLNWYGGIADEMGLDLADGIETKKKKGKLYGFTEKAARTKEQKAALKDALNVSEQLRKKEQGSLLEQTSQTWREVKSIGQVKIGEGLGAAKDIGEKVGSDLASILGRSENIRYAAIGGAIGYAGGLAYGALHDTSDPTSTYEEDRHLLGNAMKGAVAGAATTFVAAAAMNLRNVESSAGDMVAHVGTNARGMVKGATSVIMNAWRATGRMK